MVGADDRRPILTVCMGAPASGKSTWCAEWGSDVVVVSGDAIRYGADPEAVFARMMQIAKGALAEGRDVIVDACSTRAVDRSPWLFLAKKTRCTTRLVIFDTPTALCRRRDANRSRPAGRVDVYAARMKESLRVVKFEGWDEIVTVAGAT
jgi:predicted kinase